MTDAFITEANKALEQDAYHNVRRNAEGEIELFDSEGKTVITFSPTISVYDLVGVSMLFTELWQGAFNDGERDALRQFRAQIDNLKAEHGDRLTAAHIDAALKERAAWLAFFDQEAEEEAAAHAAAAEGK